MLPEHHNSELHALVATLSLGPVGFMDRLNLSASNDSTLGAYVNTSLLRRTCNAAGDLLQPARPVTITDATLRRGSSPRDDALPARGHLWATHTEMSLADGGTARHYMLLPMVLAKPFVLRSEDLHPRVPRNATAGWLRRSGRAGPCVDGAPALASGCVTKASTADGAGVELLTGDWSGQGPYPWDLVLLSPELPHGWHLLGELEKFCPTSSKRFVGPVSATASELTATLVGAAGEEVAVTAVAPGGRVAVQTVRLAASGVPQKVRFAAT